MSITETLDDREKIYGDFAQLATAAQAMKSVLRASPAWLRMTAIQREAAEMVVLKQCRIWYGDPMHFDSWRDLAGYSMLAVEEFHPSRTAQKPMTPAENPKTPLELVLPLTEAAE